MPQVYFTHDNDGLVIRPNANILEFANGALLHEYLQGVEPKNPAPGATKIINGTFEEPWRIIEHPDGNLPPETIAPFDLNQVYVVEPDGGFNWLVTPNVNVKVIL